MATISEFQERFHGEGFDYAAGSPHIKHFHLHRRISKTLQDVIREILDRRGACRVLEVGAGHGTFTDYIVAAGATVIVTEMSGPSLAHLRQRYRHNDAVQVVADADGTVSLAGEPMDVIACISVLHHIPDYLAAIDAWLGRLRPGGAFVSFQDPLWYARRTRRSRLTEKIAYLSWRLPRGEIRRGISTAVRQARGVYDEMNPSDMVEYHVMRDGVDEHAIIAMLEPEFEQVEMSRYWSTQGGAAQAIGSQLCAPNTFGVVARQRREER